MDLNYEQAKIIYDAEIAHFRGLRSSSISGPYCEDLLIQILKNVFLDEFGIGKGNIVADSDIDKDNFVKLESRDKGTRRPQVDVIVYKKNANLNFKSEVSSFCVVKDSDVIAALEIKKWLKKGDVEYYNHGKGKSLWERHYPGIPRLLIGYRIWHSKEYKFETICNENTFVFSKSLKNTSWKVKEAWINPKDRSHHIISILNNHAVNEEDKIRIIQENILKKDELERLINMIKYYSEL